MRLKTQDYNDLTVVELQGELTTDFVEMLKHTAGDLIAKKKLGIVFDLTMSLLSTVRGLRRFCGCGITAMKTVAP